MQPFFYYIRGLFSFVSVLTILKIHTLYFIGLQHDFRSQGSIHRTAYKFLSFITLAEDDRRKNAGITQTGQNFKMVQRNWAGSNRCWGDPGIAGG